MLNRIIILVFFVTVSVSAQIQAPYLLSCKASDDSTISLTWRNNDLETEFIYVYMRSSSQERYTRIDSIKGSLTSYKTTHLTASTTYYFRLIAGNQSNLSDSSNVDSTVTYRLNKKILPTFYKIRYTPGDSYNSITLFDSSNCEKEIRLFITKTTAVNSITDSVIIVPPKPKAFNSYYLKFDSLFGQLDNNTWYSFKTQTVFDTTYKTSGQSHLFTFNGDLIYDSMKHLNVYREKIGVTPVVNPKWMMKAGDSLLVLESNTPEKSITVIDISNPARPQFKGYRTISTNDLFSSYKYYVLDTNIYCLTAEYLKCYRYEKNDFTLFNIIEIPEIKEYYFGGSKGKDILYLIKHTAGAKEYWIKSVNIESSPMQLKNIAHHEYPGTNTSNFTILDSIILVGNCEIVDLRIPKTETYRVLPNKDENMYDNYEGDYVKEYYKLLNRMDTTSIYDDYLIHGMGGMGNIGTGQASTGKTDTVKVQIIYDSASGLIYCADNRLLSIYSTEPPVKAMKKGSLHYSNPAGVKISGNMLFISGIRDLKAIHFYDLQGKSVLKVYEKSLRENKPVVDLSRLNNQTYIIRMICHESIKTFLFNNYWRCCH